MAQSEIKPASIHVVRKRAAFHAIYRQTFCRDPGAITMKGHALMDQTAVQDLLARICASSGFAQAESLRKLLRHIVEKSLSGKGFELKEYSIGVEVFGRAEDFDPRQDAIVRVQVRKMRQRLEEYFASDPGKLEEIRIHIPKGTYVPTIERVVVAEPLPVSEPTPVVPRQVPPRFWHRKALIAAVLATLPFAAWGVWRFEQPLGSASGQQPASIAVLPFVNLSGDQSQDYFGEGLAEEILDRLARTPGLRVAARSSSFRVKSRGVSPVEAARELGVRYLLEGSVRKTNDRVRVTVQLVDAASGFHRWTSSFDRNSADMISLQDELAQAICQRIQPQMRILREAASDTRPKQVSWEGYDAYLRGLYHWKRTTSEGYQAAIECFREAIDRDPGFAPPYHFLALSYSGLAAYALAPPRETWALARSYAERALAIDEKQFGGHVVLGGYQAWYEWDYAGFETYYKRALELAPNQPEVHQFYASFLAAMGRKDEARIHMERALQLDPQSNPVRWGAAQIHYWWANYTEAHRLLDAVLASDADYAAAYSLRCAILLAEGKPQEVAKVRHDGSPRISAYRALALFRMNDRAAALKALAPLLQKDVRIDYSIAAALYEIGPRHEEGMRMLDQAIEARLVRPPQIRIDPLFAAMRKHPDMPAILAKAKITL